MKSFDPDKVNQFRTYTTTGSPRTKNTNVYDHAATSVPSTSNKDSKSSVIMANQKNHSTLAVNQISDGYSSIGTAQRFYAGPLSKKLKLSLMSGKTSQTQLESPRRFLVNNSSGTLKSINDSLVRKSNNQVYYNPVNFLPDYEMQKSI